MNRKYNLWGGRFAQDTSDLMKSFNQSLSIDKRLFKEDVNCSKAWSLSLREVGLLSQEEVDLIHKGLDQIEDEWRKDEFIICENDEDIHAAHERRLSELIGDVAMKLHTGRSRNDQVATDMKLWLITNLDILKETLLDLIKTLVIRAHNEIDLFFPGYTHLQRAQTIRWSHLLLSYACSLDRDYIRLEATKNQTQTCPLGSGAIAGNPFNIDRNHLASHLAFTSATINSIDSIQSRDYIYECLFVCSSIGINLSKIAEDLIIYSTKEFSFVHLSDLYSTGSSLMPQKKNPDSLELIRGKSGRLIGNLNSFLITLKGLPTSYNKDLQEDKQILFDSYDTTISLLRLTQGVFETLNLNEVNILKALSTDLLSTDIAYYLVRRKQIPFRQAHYLAGKCVALAEKLNCPLNELSLNQFKSISTQFDEDIYEIFSFEASVEQYTSYGGTARVSVEKQIEYFKEKYSF